MKIKKLLKEISIPTVKGSKDIEITGICGNSKLVAPGNLFVAKRGKVYDGTQYIPEAISAGASAVLTDIYDPSLKDVTQLIHPDVSMMEALIAAHYYQFAGSELFMVGITGTNGKTTTSFLIKHMLDKLEQTPCGLIGTVEYVIGKHRYQPTHTTPDVTTNQKLLREMVLQGCRSAVMEVTSHALDQGRMRHIDYDVAVFTNLTVDHLDYHQTMEQYCLAKQKLFKSLGKEPSKGKKNFLKSAVVNADSPWKDKVTEGCAAAILTYGIESNADLRATDIHMHGDATHFTLTYQGRKYSCESPLVGRYNVYNVLAALGVMLSRQIPLETLIPLIPTFVPVPGRLERVPNDLGLKIFVDFAHTDDALTNVLECLRELKAKRIITVFGCGGDRDKTKRPKMARACEQLSDICIVTSDNPRSEDPQSIINQILEGFRSKDKHIVEVDRAKAIEKAIDMMKSDDILLIAGKGHEPYQIFAHKIVEFDDRKVAAQICQSKRNRK